MGRRMENGWIVSEYLDEGRVMEEWLLPLGVFPPPEPFLAVYGDEKGEIRTEPVYGFLMCSGKAKREDSPYFYFLPIVFMEGFLRVDDSNFIYMKDRFNEVCLGVVPERLYKEYEEMFKEDAKLHAESFRKYVEKIRKRGRESNL
jgi:hypothetical protein